MTAGARSPKSLDARLMEVFSKSGPRFRNPRASWHQTPPALSVKAPLLVTGMLKVASLCGLAFLTPCAWFVIQSCAPSVEAAPQARLSLKALEMVRDLKGQSLRLDGLGPTDEPLYVKDCYIGPNPVSGHGAVVILATDEALAGPVPINAPQGADGQWYLPLSSDADAAHFLLAAGAKPPADLVGPPSRLYCRVVGLQ